MKSLQKIILLALIGTLFVTCKKETLAPGSDANQPVFSFSGNVGGTALNLQAGVNNYYMYSSDSQNVAGVYNFIGTLKNISTNKNSIQIIISDYEVSAKNASVASHINSSLSTTRTYSYAIPGVAPTGYSVNFTPVIYSGTASTYSYSFGDNNTSNAISPSHTYKSPGKYPTSLTIKYTNSNTVTMGDTITILKTQPQLWIDNIQSTIDSVVGTKALVAFTATVSDGGTSPYTYTWNFGDGTKKTTLADSICTVQHTYYDSLHKTYPVYLRVTNSAGDTESYNYNVWPFDTTYSGDLMTYKISPPQVIQNADSLPDVVINYTDANGNVYTSNNALQSGNSSFQVLSVAGYQNNSSNEPTKMLKVSFNCTLYNGSKSIPASGTAIIAVAYQ